MHVWRIERMNISMNHNENKWWHEHEVDFNRLSLLSLMPPPPLLRLLSLVHSFVHFDSFACLLAGFARYTAHTILYFILKQWGKRTDYTPVSLFAVLARHLKYATHFSPLVLFAILLLLIEQNWGRERMSEWESPENLKLLCILTILNARVRYTKHKTFWRAFIVHSIFD